MRRRVLPVTHYPQLITTYIRFDNFYLLFLKYCLKGVIWASKKESYAPNCRDEALRSLTWLHLIGQGGSARTAGVWVARSERVPARAACTLSHLSHSRTVTLAARFGALGQLLEFDLVVEHG